jgi:hypothetical protein
MKTLALVTSVLALGSSTALNAQTNAFPEGSFDLGLQTTTDPKTNCVPYGWEFLDGRTPGFPNVTFSTVTSEGNKFARLVNDNTNPDAWAETSKALNGSGGVLGLKTTIAIPKSRPTHIRINCRVRAPEIHTGTGLSWASFRDHPIFLDAANKAIGKPRPPILFNITSPAKDWVEREITINPIPPEAAFFQLQPGMFNATGILEIDDYQVFFETILE